MPSESNKPNNMTGNEFALGTAMIKYVDDSRWQASKAYAVGDYCFTESSSWLPVFCYECITAGISNGWRPTHASGTVIEGEDVYPKNLDACYWEYVGPLSSFVAAEFSPNMNVQNNTYIYADHKIYKVLNSGRLRERPPIDTAWRGAFTEGTARLSFMGKDWAPVTWWARDCYCVSMVNGVRTVYKLVNQDGTTSGQIPVSGNAMSVDGDMIWEYTTDTATKQWAAQTQFFEGDVVSANGNNYRCVFDGRLELPHQISLENISTNMDTGGDIFAFWEAGTDVPTKVGPKGKWTIRIDNVEFYRFRQFSSYFCHAGNPAPEILIGGSGSGGSSGGSSGTDANAIHDGDSVVIDAGEV